MGDYDSRMSHNSLIDCATTRARSSLADEESSGSILGACWADNIHFNIFEINESLTQIGSSSVRIAGVIRWSTVT